MTSRAFEIKLYLKQEFLYIKERVLGVDQYLIYTPDFL